VSTGQPSEGKSSKVKSNEATPESLARKYVELGDYYFKAGRFSDAVEAYGKARSYAPNDASVHFVLADAVFATGDYHFAAFLIAEALRLDPSLATAETDKRLFYGDPKVFDEQMAALDRYLDISSTTQAHLVRGYNLRFSDKKEAAIAAFRRVLEIASASAAQVFLDALVPKAADAPAKV
jgi:tetratricopeptide (TPR) repeat protein